MIVIGGLGGSGTRLIAGIIRESGIYLGDDLNESLDNLSFTLLFKRPRWYFKGGANTSAGLNLLINQKAKSLIEIRFLLRATLEGFIYGHQRDTREGQGMWALKRAAYLLPPSQKAPLQGWKEPNSWVYLSALATYIPDLQYIHVIRGGTVMAYHRNQNQFASWGQLFNLPASYSPAHALDFWIMANEVAIQRGERLLGNRFYLLNYDDFCAQPESNIQHLSEFLNLKMSPSLANRVIQKESRPPDLSPFSVAQLLRVDALIAKTR